jgi:hypothetical protein
MLSDNPATAHIKRATKITLNTRIVISKHLGLQFLQQQVQQRPQQQRHI